MLSYYAILVDDARIDHDFFEIHQLPVLVAFDSEAGTARVFNATVMGHMPLPVQQMTYPCRSKRLWHSSIPCKPWVVGCYFEFLVPGPSVSLNISYCSTIIGGVWWF